MARVRGSLPDSTLLFTGLLMMSALVTQRFAVTIGASYLSIEGPIGFLLAGYGLVKGHLALHPVRLALFAALTSCVLLGGVLRAAVPQPFGTTPSALSALQFLVFTSFGVLAFARPCDERRFFRVVNVCFMFVGVCGIAQFLLQFAGIRLFSFDDFIPQSYLFQGWNTAIPIGTSGYFKSNGLFLVEPSVFSQDMALAIVVEILLFRRALYMVVFCTSLMMSTSGTGWVLLLSFVLTASFSLGARGVKLSLATIATGVLALVGFASLFPAAFDVFISRTDEVYTIGSSGHDRFVTPWWFTGWVLTRTPMAAIYGLGPGVTEHMAMSPPYLFNTNPPVKVGLEYGFPTFLVYLMYILASRRTMTQKALVAPTLVLLLVDGGNSHFPPALFLVLLLISIADLAPSTVASVRTDAPRRFAGPANISQDGERAFVR